jgi:hypothetical protein
MIGGVNKTPRGMEGAEASATISIAKERGTAIAQSV